MKRKKKFKIFVLPSHQTAERTSGVDYVRLISPMSYLAKHPDFDITVWQTDNNAQWPQIAKEFDAIYFGYLNNAWGFAAMGAMARHYKRKLIMDLDDNLWEIKPDNVAYDIFKKGSDGLKTITAIAREVDHITVTNEYLKNAVAYATDKPYEKIKVFPNYIDLSYYSYKAKPKNEYNVNIGHFGSTTHFESLQNNTFMRAMDRIMQDFPNVTFTTIGSFIGDFRKKWGHRYINGFGDVDIYKWIGKASRPLMDGIDFVVAPLIDDTYNRCKSATKFNEVSSFARPGVWQNIRQYREVVSHGTDGYLATSDKDWYESMKALIQSHDHRVKMGENAYAKVSENYQVQDHVEDYAKWFTNILLTEK